MPFIPLVCDFVLKDEVGDASSTFRFDNIEAQADPEEVDLAIDHLGVRVIVEADAFSLPVPIFRDFTQQFETFVERAFAFPRGKWPHTLDDDLSIEFSMSGTRVSVSIASTGFFRVFDYSEPDGVPTISGAAFVASSPMRVWSWITSNDSVESLIQMNTPGEANPGGI